MSAQHYVYEVVKTLISPCLQQFEDLCFRQNDLRSVVRIAVRREPMVRYCLIPQPLANRSRVNLMERNPPQILEISDMNFELLGTPNPKRTLTTCCS
ncbi:hypothetical protein Trydic_g1313 [Trypoxylus dichotomus]